MTTQLLTPSEAAAVIQVPERTLGQWRYRKIGPAWCRIGRHIRYDPTDLERWIASQRHEVNAR